MIKFYKTINNSVQEISQLEPGCWVTIVAPDEKEIEHIINVYHLDAGFVKASLDEEESSHIEIEDDQTLIIVDYPVAEILDKKTSYFTMPMGLILTKENVFTISVKENILIDEMANGTIRNIQTNMKTRFVLIFLLKIATKYIAYLKQIDKMSSFTERQLHKAMKNKELIQLLGLEKSLVYFSTSLKANEVTLQKILRGRVIKLYEEDQELLEDVVIEVKQAIEMSNIYSSILSGMMDAFASIISNNLNIVMKRLTIITIIMAIPTIVFSLYGMNVDGLPFSDTPWFAVGISLVVSTVLGMVLFGKKER